jgi:hypothetical protein
LLKESPLILRPGQQPDGLIRPWSFVGLFDDVPELVNPEFPLHLA